jgi:hypothetical protein
VENVDAFLDELVALGLDGVEAYHSSHGPLIAEAYRKDAVDLGLLVTGGSDFHGDPNSDGPRQPGAQRLGGVPLPPDEWQRFQEAFDALEPKETA